jgi:acetyltransferase-like isoleucine patch superfamily enzyme
MPVGWNEEIKKELGFCGKNVFIGHNVIITQPHNVYLGDNVRIDPFTLITAKLVTGDNVQITSHVVIGGSYNTVHLHDWTFIGYGSQLFTNSEDYSGEEGPVNEFWGNGKVYKGDIYFQKYSGVASQVIVFPGVTLPEGCCIGAQSLVPRKHNLEEYNVYVGNPLRHLKKRNKENIIEFANDPNFLKDRAK